MVKIRLARGGMKNDPHYKIVVIEKSKKRDGEPLDVIGFWYPKKDEKKIDKEKLNKWIEQGARPSAAVDKLINQK